MPRKLTIISPEEKSAELTFQQGGLIEELETALSKYAGAILYVSHDGYFRDAIGGDVVVVGH